ncbi:ABC transporter ATP-binding protein [Finegoldia magna]|uniref:ABC transporter ATP-binding protein n=1 Tax=Finegoldia magna TaxID=1260 RepID=UPI0012AF90B6|nr:ABC transporter ATP-binding protein [Finegoldia magna]MSB17358.1 ATP-binding cassette domain-containing protein [Finegoldia magna]MSD46475.1 ATP-binding cassette domain-containing protein [Finegoldia magna]
MSVLEIKNLSKKYGNKQALNDVSFTAEKGEVIGLLGPNGSGKTTLIKILAGIIKKYEGEVNIDSQEVNYKTKEFVSYLPDRFFLDPNLTIAQTQALFEDFYSDFDGEKFTNFIEQMSLDKKMKISNLSKGMTEKLNLALVLSRHAKLFIIDEPIAGVDPVAREQILDAIIDNIDPDSTLVITTHLVRDIERIFDRVIMLNKGSVELNDSVENLRSTYNKGIEDVYKQIFGGQHA